MEVEDGEPDEVEEPEPEPDVELEPEPLPLVDDGAFLRTC